MDRAIENKAASPNPLPPTQRQVPLPKLRSARTAVSQMLLTRPFPGTRHPLVEASNDLRSKLRFRQEGIFKKNHAIPRFTRLIFCARGGGGGFISGKRVNWKLFRSSAEFGVRNVHLQYCEESSSRRCAVRMLQLSKPWRGKNIFPPLKKYCYFCLVERQRGEREWVFFFCKT